MLPCEVREQLHCGVPCFQHTRHTVSFCNFDRLFPDLLGENLIRKRRLQKSGCSFYDESADTNLHKSFPENVLQFSEVVHVRAGRRAHFETFSNFLSDISEVRERKRRNVILNTHDGSASIHDNRSDISSGRQMAAAKTSRVLTFDDRLSRCLSALSVIKSQE